MNNSLVPDNVKKLVMFLCSTYLHFQTFDRNYCNVMSLCQTFNLLSTHQQVDIIASVLRMFLLDQFSHKSPSTLQKLCFLFLFDCIHLAIGIELQSVKGEGKVGFNMLGYAFKIASKPHESDGYDPTAFLETLLQNNRGRILLEPCKHLKAYWADITNSQLRETQDSFSSNCVRKGFYSGTRDQPRTGHIPISQEKVMKDLLEGKYERMINHELQAEDLDCPCFYFRRIFLELNDFPTKFSSIYDQDFWTTIVDGSYGKLAGESGFAFTKEEYRVFKIEESMRVYPSKGQILEFQEKARRITNIYSKRHSPQKVRRSFCEIVYICAQDYFKGEITDVLEDMSHLGKKFNSGVVDDSSKASLRLYNYVKADFYTKNYLRISPEILKEMKMRGVERDRLAERNWKLGRVDLGSIDPPKRKESERKNFEEQSHESACRDHWFQFTEFNSMFFKQFLSCIFNHMVQDRANEDPIISVAKRKLEILDSFDDSKIFLPLFRRDSSSIVLEMAGMDMFGLNDNHVAISSLFSAGFTGNFHKLWKRFRKSRQKHFQRGQKLNGYQNSIGLLISKLTPVEEFLEKKRLCNDKGFCSTCFTDELKGKKFKVCSRCKTVSYCSVKCQKEDWKIHKKNCTSSKK